MKRQLIALAAILAIVISLISLYRGRHPRGIKPDDRYSTGLGDVLAEEAANLTGSRGRVLLLARRDQVREADQAASADPVVDGFQMALKRFSGVQLAGTEPVAQCLDPVMHTQSTLIPPADYLEILKRHPDVTVVVSLAGAPVFQPADMARLPARRPKLAVLYFGDRARLEGLIRAGIVNMAVVPRARSVPATAPAPNAPRDYFNRLYTILTAANLDQPPQ